MEQNVDREVKHLSNIERLPRELVYQLIEYATESVAHLQLASKLLKSRVEEYACLRNTVATANTICLNFSLIYIEMPTCCAHLFELRLRMRQLDVRFPTLRCYQDDTDAAHHRIKYAFSTDGLTGVESCLESLAACLGTRFRKVTLRTGWDSRTLKLLNEKSIDHMEVALKKLSDHSFDSLKTIQIDRLSIKVHGIDNSCNPGVLFSEFRHLIDLSSIVRSMCIRAYYDTINDQLGLGAFGALKIDWPTVILEMFARKLDKLFIWNGCDLSEDDIDLLKERLPKIGKKVWLVAKNINEVDFTTYIAFDHKVQVDYEYLRIRHVSREHEPHGFY